MKRRHVWAKCLDQIDLDKPKCPVLQMRSAGTQGKRLLASFPGVWSARRLV